MSTLLSPNHPARKTLRRWHNYTGLAVALLLILSGVSGSLLAYKKPLLQTAFAEPLPEGYSIQQVAAELDKLAIQFPPDTLSRLKAPNTQEPYWQILTQDQQRYLLAPETLQILAHNHALLQAFEWVRLFHTELLTGLAGEVLLFIMSALTLFLLVSGLLLWWPARKRLRWRWLLPQKIQGKHLIQYHRHSGALWLLVVLLVVLTGTIMLEQRLEHALFAGASPQTTGEKLDKTSDVLPSSQLFQQAAKELPGAWPTYIRLPSSASPSSQIRFRLAGEWHPNGRTTITVDSVTAGLEPYTRSDAVPVGKRLMNQLYPLHSGYGLNGIYQFLVFMSGVVCCWLAGTGFMHWWRRRQG